MPLVEHVRKNVRERSTPTVRLASRASHPHAGSAVAGLLFSLSLRFLLREKERKRGRGGKFYIYITRKTILPPAKRTRLADAPKYLSGMCHDRQFRATRVA